MAKDRSEKGAPGEENRIPLRLARRKKALD